MQLRILGLFLLILSGCAHLSPSKMDALSPRLNKLIAQYPQATIAVSVIDLAHGTELHIQGETAIHAASTMKVPVMIELFKQFHAGRFKPTDSLEVVNRFRSIVDGSPFSISDDSDDQIYGRLGQKMSLRDLAFNMITVSSNLATNLLIDQLDAKNVQATIEALGTTRMKVRRGVEDQKAFDLGLNNEATSHDLARMMAALARAQVVSPQWDAEMIEILKAQRFNEMIPKGIPVDAAVAHKTGEITAHRHDAAIVYPKGKQPYVLVILTKGIEDEKAAYSLGVEISKTVYEILRKGF